MVCKTRTEISRLAVRQQSNVSVGQVVAVVLEPLAAANIFAEDEIIPCSRTVSRRGHTVRKESELGARSVRHFQDVYLGHVGKTCPNQHLAPRGVPVIKRGRAKFSVALR